MSSILEELYTGNTRPPDNLYMEAPPYKQANRQYSELLQCFYGDLSPAQRASYRRMEDAQSAVWDLEKQASFAQGFHLGAAIILELYQNPDSRTHH